MVDAMDVLERLDAGGHYESMSSPTCSLPGILAEIGIDPLNDSMDLSDAPFTNPFEFEQGVQGMDDTDGLLHDMLGLGYDHPSPPQEVPPAPKQGAYASLEAQIYRQQETIREQAAEIERLRYGGMVPGNILQPDEYLSLEESLTAEQKRLVNKYMQKHMKPPCGVRTKVKAMDKMFGTTVTAVLNDRNRNPIIDDNYEDVKRTRLQRANVLQACLDHSWRDINIFSVIDNLYVIDESYVRACCVAIVVTIYGTD
jgi:hypothetical protein